MERLTRFKLNASCFETPALFSMLNQIKDELAIRFDELTPDERVYLGMLRDLCDMRKSQL